MKKVIILVIDSMGIGAMDDCLEYNDIKQCNTLCNVAKYVNGLNVPTLEKLNLGNLCKIQGVKPNEIENSQYGIMIEKSKGKCTTTGHWEMAGIILDKPFKTYPQGFNSEIINAFINNTGCKGILGNYPASGTKIIEDLYLDHQKTKYPIIYTSADSVFQIAVDIDIIPIDTLYDWCIKARKILINDNNVSRVIARPFKMENNKPVRISSLRRDFSVSPFKDTILDHILKNNGIVLGIGKIEDIFVKKGISHSIHTGSNKEGLELTIKAIKNELNLDELKIDTDINISINPEYKLIFTNLVDTDMLYGHRNDPIGYAKAIEEIDSYLPEIINNLSNDDLLIITADHGCDPTVPGTDHTREKVPVLIYNKMQSGKNLGEIFGFDFIAKTIKKWFDI